MQLKKTLAALIFIPLFLYIFFVFAQTFYGDYFLPRNGLCKKALLIDKISRTRSSKTTLYYRVIINGKDYEQNSLEADLTKVGDSVCIVYLKSSPSINRPLKYFDKGEIKCDCN